MITLEISSRYKKELKKFVKGRPEIIKKIYKAIDNFTTDINYPALNTEKLTGQDIWTFRIDRGNRIYFKWINDEQVLLVDIGPHDKYRKYNRKLIFYAR